MSVTLTFFREKSSQAADIFIEGTTTKPGSNGEWILLQQSQRLAHLKINFEVVEYGQGIPVPEEHKSKVKYSPYLDIRNGNDVDNSIAYPRAAPNTADSIATWALKSIDFFGVLKEIETGSLSDSTESTVESIEIATEGVKSDTRSKLRTAGIAVGSIALGTLFVGICTKLVKNHLDEKNKFIYGFFDENGPVRDDDIKWSRDGEDNESWFDRVKAWIPGFSKNGKAEFEVLSPEQSASEDFHTAFGEVQPDAEL